MNLSLIQKRATAVFRLIVLAVSLTDVLGRFCLLRLRRGRRLSLSDRAEWLHRACAIIVRRLSMSVSACGPVPASGLVVSNHLSHLDILLYAAAMPCIFVSKSEVLTWPMFGILARCGGTIFVERHRRHGVGDPAASVVSALKAEIPVLLYPEGTSTDGSTVLPFHSSFLQPAVSTGTPIISAAIGYAVSSGAEVDLCYYGEIRFFPHLLSVLGRDGTEGRIIFCDNPQRYTDRKIAAKATWSEVVALREKLLACNVPVWK
jgi:1-acyl-sn-glycerol-3-phosphate acyltransferase